MPLYVELLIVLALILLNSFFALAELAIVSSRKSRLQRLASDGDRRAQTALELANEPSQFLSSVQVGITLIGILAGAIGGIALEEPLANLLGRIPGLSPTLAATAAFILVVGGLTYVTVTIGELVPKQVALNNPERWAMRVAPAMRFFAWFATPLVALLSGTSNLIVRLLRLPKHDLPVSDEEVSMLFEEGISAGVFEPAEKEIVDRLFRLSDRRVNAVMTPRTEVVWLDVEATPEEITETLITSPFTAYPVCRGNLDHMEGVVLATDILAERLRDRPVHLPALLHPPLTLYEGVRALPAIERLKESGAHLAIIIDEYGGTEGILTLIDLVESLVGELPSLEPPDIVRRPDGSYLVDGQLPIDELKDLLDVEALPQEDAGYQTLAGLLITNLDRIPAVGDHFEWESFRFEVVDMDGTRVDRVLITPLTP
ncbi:MAG: hemolysin family protein [Armatimonadota bacterium]